MWLTFPFPWQTGRKEDWGSSREVGTELTVRKSNVRSFNLTVPGIRGCFLASYRRHLQPARCHQYSAVRRTGTGSFRQTRASNATMGTLSRTMVVAPTVRSKVPQAA